MKKPLALILLASCAFLAAGQVISSQIAAPGIIPTPQQSTATGESGTTQFEHLSGTEGMLPKGVHPERSGDECRTAAHWRYARAPVGERSRGGRSVCPAILLAAGGTPEGQDVGCDLAAEAGENVLAVEVANYNAFGSVGVNLNGELRNRSVITKTFSDSTWRVSPQAPEGWRSVRFDDRGWLSAAPKTYPFQIIQPDFDTGRLSWIER